MAKQKDPQPTSPGEMTIMLIKLKGNDATLQEGIRTFKEAMGRALPEVAARVIPPQVIMSTQPSAPPETADLFTEVDSVQTNDADADKQSTSTTAVPKPQRDRKFPVMEFVKDLNLHPKDKKPLKDFVAEKKPNNQTARITVCVYYLCRVLDVKGVTGDHVYTCLKAIGAKTPNDLPQEMRNISKRRGFIDASNGDDIRITNPGDNFVEHELPPTGSK